MAATPTSRSSRKANADARRKLAIEYVGTRDIGFSEVSYRLGFSHVAAFHRAFRLENLANAIDFVLG